MKPVAVFECLCLLYFTLQIIQYTWKRERIKKAAVSEHHTYAANEYLISIAKP